MKVGSKFSCQGLSSEEVAAFMAQVAGMLLQSVLLQREVSSELHISIPIGLEISSLKHRSLFCGQYRLIHDRRNYRLCERLEVMERLFSFRMR